MVNRKTRPPTRAQAPSPPQTPGWYVALEAARLVQESNSGAGFTAREISDRLPVPSKIAAAVASAWCSKFVAWSYAKRVGTIGGGRGRGRAANIYQLTEYGLSKEKPIFSRGRTGVPCPHCGGSGITTPE